MISLNKVLSLSLLAVATTAWSQSTADPQSAPPPQSTQQDAPRQELQNSGQTQPQSATPAPHGRSAGGDVGSGAGDIGKGTAGAAGNVAKGTGKGAVDLVTLHPIDAAGNVGKGAAVGGKDLAVGAGKGTGKIAKGTGRGIGHLFHHGHKNEDTAPPSEPPQQDPR